MDDRPSSATAMRILGIETSRQPGEIAICRGDDCIAEEEIAASSRRGAQSLVRQIADVLKQLDLAAADLDAIAVSIGPGSFTGLRVGVVCAKTLAYATRRPLAAVDTMEAIAANSPDDVNVVHAVTDALRGDLFVGTFRRSADDGWVRLEPIAVVNALRWLAARHAGEAITGPGLSRYAAEVPSACRVLAEPAWRASARRVAQIGMRQVVGGAVADPLSLEPFYLRPSAAEERNSNWDARAAGRDVD